MRGVELDWVWQQTTDRSLYEGEKRILWDSGSTPDHLILEDSIAGRETMNLED